MQYVNDYEPEHFCCSPAISLWSPSSTTRCSDCRKASAPSALRSFDDDDEGEEDGDEDDIVACLVDCVCVRARGPF